MRNSSYDPGSRITVRLNASWNVDATTFQAGDKMLSRDRRVSALGLLKLLAISIFILLFFMLNLYSDSILKYFKIPYDNFQIKLISLLALSICIFYFAIDLYSYFLYPEVKKYKERIKEYEQIYRELSQQNSSLQQQLRSLQNDAKKYQDLYVQYYNLFAQCNLEMERLRQENMMLRQEIQNNVLQMNDLRKELDKLRNEIDRIKREFNPQPEQLVKLYNELVRDLSRSREHLDTTFFDKLLLIAYENLIQGNTLEAQYILKLVEKLSYDEEILARLRRLYIIGFTSRYIPKNL